MEHGLDLAGVDVDPAADEHVLGAAHDVEVAVVVESAQVAGSQPPVDQGLGGLIGVAPVAGHHLLAFHPDFAHFSGRDEVATVVMEFDPDARYRPATRFQQLGACGQGQVVVLGQQSGDIGYALGDAVRLV